MSNRDIDLALGGESSGRALVLAGGDLDPHGEQIHLLQGPWDLVVCADSGAAHALSLQLTPDVLVGDMDSIDSQTKQAMANIRHLTFPSEKDKTDSHLAVEWCLNQGATDLVLAGGLGSRFDHSLANAHLLSFIYRRGAKGVVTDGRQAVYLLKQQPLTLEGEKGMGISVLPLTPCKGLVERGLKWELDGFDLPFGDTRTISNEFTEDPAVLSLDKGEALVIVGPIS